MVDAGEKVRQALADKGFAPRAREHRNLNMFGNANRRFLYIW